MASGRIWSLTQSLVFSSNTAKRPQRAKITWKQNALRHSFISYRLAEVKDQNLVALEAGKSPKMIHKHYRELATPEQARSWFAIEPSSAKNVIVMRNERSMAYNR